MLLQHLSYIIAICIKSTTKQTYSSMQVHSEWKIIKILNNWTYCPGTRLTFSYVTFNLESPDNLHRVDKRYQCTIGMCSSALVFFFLLSNTGVSKTTIKHNILKSENLYSRGTLGD